MAEEVHGRLVAWGHQPEESVFLDFEADSGIRAGEKWERLPQDPRVSRVSRSLQRAVNGLTLVLCGITHAPNLGAIRACSYERLRDSQFSTTLLGLGTCCERSTIQTTIQSRVPSLCARRSRWVLSPKRNNHQIS
jgi:hypothetical protein